MISGAEADERLEEFDKGVQEARGGVAAPEGLGEDEDLRIEDGDGSLAPNAQCPISAKPVGQTCRRRSPPSWQSTLVPSAASHTESGALQVLELDEPVEDRRGFVYEKADIERYIQQHERRQGGPCPCPVSGTSHSVALADLRVARAVLRAKQRAQRQGAGRGGRSAADVLDVE